MNDFTKIETLLNIVKSKIDAYNEFKNEYDKQLAFDFSLFNFFNVGENKISQILAYFLDEKQNHGQGNIFLNEFVKQFYGKLINTSNTLNTCEKVITNNRRIDIYIEIGNLIIAIENKIWSDDQDKQLKDYATYLKKKSNDNFLLLYLTPYGYEPRQKSISEEFKNILIEKNQLKIISYKDDIIPLINKWLTICEADNVSHFIKEFKKYLEIKFLGKNTLNMSKKLREIIYQNEREVQSLVNEYKTIENEIISKLNSIGKILSDEVTRISSDLIISKKGPFNWYKKRIYKYSVSKGKNKIWIQLIQHNIHLYSNYYFEDGTDAEFIDIAENTKQLNKKIIIDHNKTNSELVALFLKQVEIARNIFTKYEKFINEK